MSDTANIKIRPSVTDSYKESSCRSPAPSGRRIEGTKLLTTVITVVKNGAGTIRNCLQSVAEQGIKIEHLIIDGGSSDDTCAIVRDVAGSHASAVKYRIISEPDKGIYDAMNKGLKAATGEIICILNADDVYASKDVLKTVSSAFEYSSLDSCYGDLDYVDPATGKVTRHWVAGEYRRDSFLWGWMPPHPVFFVRKSAYDRFGLFRLDMGSSADYELMLRFLYKHGISSKYIPGVMVRMGSGGISNKTLAQRLRAHCKDREAWRVNDLRPYPWTLLMKPVRKIHQFLP